MVQRGRSGGAVSGMVFALRIAELILTILLIGGQKRSAALQDTSSLKDRET